MGRTAEDKHVAAANRGQVAQDYTHTGHGKPEPLSIHPENTDDASAARRREREEQEIRFRAAIAHLPLRRQRKMLAKYGLEGPQGGAHVPQQVLSRRTRRAMARATQKDRKGLEIGVQAGSVLAGAPDKTPDAPDYSGMNLSQLRTAAQDKGLRVDGRRPSLCSKAELIEALREA